MSSLCPGHIAHIAVIRHLKEPFGTRETNSFPKQIANSVWNFLDSQLLFKMSSRRLVYKQFFLLIVLPAQRVLETEG